MSPIVTPLPNTVYTFFYFQGLRGGMAQWPSLRTLVVTLHNNLFVIDSLTIFTTQMVDFETYSRIVLLLVFIA